MYRSNFYGYFYTLQANLSCHFSFQVKSAYQLHRQMKKLKEEVKEKKSEVEKSTLGSQLFQNSMRSLSLMLRVR